MRRAAGLLLAACASLGAALGHAAAGEAPQVSDAAVQGGLPAFPQIYGGYFVYKAGASAIGFLVARHGDDAARSDPRRTP